MVPFAFTRCNLEGEDFFYSHDHISFFGASSPEEAASSFLDYWSSETMLCLGLWDGESKTRPNVPEWVVFRLPKQNPSVWYYSYLVDGSVEVLEKKLIPEWSGTAWYMDIEGLDDTGFKLRFSCIVHKSTLGRRWQVHFPKVESLVRGRTAEYE